MIFELFTDGSSFIGKDLKASASAYSIYIYNRKICSDGKFLDDGTNNLGESHAILSGLKRLNKCIGKIRSNSVKPPYRIRVYTDSLITRDACKEWIYKWLKNARKGIMYTSSNEPVSNQHIFKEIYDKFLVDEMYEIEFLHLNSHCIENKIYTNHMEKIKEHIKNINTGKPCPELPKELFTDKKFKKAKASFLEKNKLDISDIDLLRLLIYNREVDELASKILNEGLENKLGSEDDSIYGKKEKVKKSKKAK